MTDSNILRNEWLAGDFLETLLMARTLLFMTRATSSVTALPLDYIFYCYSWKMICTKVMATTKQPSSASRFLIRGKSNSWSLYLGDGDSYASLATRILSCTILLLDYSCWLWARNSYKIHSVWSKCTRSNVGAWDWELSVSNSGTRNLTQHKVDVRLSVSCK